MDFCEAVSQLKIGDPNELDTEFGAISSKQQFDKINYFIDIVNKENGKILLGGKPIKLSGRCKDGWFIEPTVVEGLDNTSRVNQEEIFGPLVTLQSFKTEKEAIQIANDTDYGLSATIWTNNIERSERVVADIEAGIVWVNCWMVRDLRTPFGGMKNSGLGREGGDNVLRFFTEQKNICSVK